MKILWFVLAFLVGPGELEAQDLASLTYLTEEYPLSSYLEGGLVKGFSVDVLRAVWKQAQVPPQPVQVLPWARAYEMIQTRPDQVLFAMARIPEREALFRWAGPIFRVRYVLAAHRGVSALGSLEAAKALRVGVVRGDVGERLLMGEGFAPERLDLSATMELAFQKLAGGRVDLAFISEKSLPEYEMKLGLPPGALVPVVTVSENPLYFAFSLDTPAAVVRQFQAALDAVDRQRRELVQAAGEVP